MKSKKTRNSKYIKYIKKRGGGSQKYRDASVQQKSQQNKSKKLTGSNWVKYYDPSSKAPYWHNAVTGISTWNNPTTISESRYNNIGSNQPPEGGIYNNPEYNYLASKHQREQHEKELQKRYAEKIKQQNNLEYFKLVKARHSARKNKYRPSAVGKEKILQGIKKASNKSKQQKLNIT